MRHDSDRLLERCSLTDGLSKNSRPGLTMRWTLKILLAIAVLVSGLLVLEVGVRVGHYASLSRVPWSLFTVVLETCFR